MKASKIRSIVTEEVADPGKHLGGNLRKPKDAGAIYMCVEAGGCVWGRDYFWSCEII